MRKKSKDLVSEPVFDPTELLAALGANRTSRVAIAKELNKNPETVRRVFLGRDSKISVVLGVARQLGCTAELRITRGKVAEEAR